MTSEAPAPMAAIIGRWVVIAIAHVSWFWGHEFSGSLHTFFAWVCFEGLCACLFLRFMDPVFVSRARGAFCGVAISAIVLRLPMDLPEAWVWIIALAPPAIGYLVWARWNARRERAEAVARDDYRPALRRYERQHPGASAQHPQTPRPNAETDGKQ